MPRSYAPFIHGAQEGVQGIIQGDDSLRASMKNEAQVREELKNYQEALDYALDHHMRNQAAILDAIVTVLKRILNP